MNTRGLRKDTPGQPCKLHDIAPDYAIDVSRPASRRVRIVFASWVGAILLVVVPWGAFQNHPHWDQVLWVPFVSGPLRVRDIVANVVFYVPFGVLYVRRFRTGVRHAVLAAAVLSILTELTQVYSHGRFPSSTDIVCNTVGACCGAVWAASRAADDRTKPRA
jgi:glycopeptide antibiotics resistance protein